MNKLEIAVLAGADSKAWLEGFTTQVDRLEKLTAKLTNAKTGEDTETEEEFIAPKKTAKKQATKDFDMDEEEEEVDEIDAAALNGDDETFEEETPKKSAKTKKVTLDDVLDACKAYAKENGKAEVLAILKKKFKVKSVTDLETEQYADVVKALKV